MFITTSEDQAMSEEDQCIMADQNTEDGDLKSKKNQSNQKWSSLRKSHNQKSQSKNWLKLNHNSSLRLPTCQSQRKKRTMMMTRKMMTRKTMTRKLKLDQEDTSDGERITTERVAEKADTAREVTTTRSDK
jgi:hypothetical protein